MSERSTRPRLAAVLFVCATWLFSFAACDHTAEIGAVPEQNEHADAHACAPGSCETGNSDAEGDAAVPQVESSDGGATSDSAAGHGGGGSSERSSARAEGEGPRGSAEREFPDSEDELQLARGDGGVGLPLVLCVDREARARVLTIRCTGDQSSSCNVKSKNCGAYRCAEDGASCRKRCELDEHCAAEHRCEDEMCRPEDAEPEETPFPPFPPLS